MTPKEDQQPMTTREELVALRDWVRRPDYADEFSLADVVEWINERPVATVERLASRQEVSVTVEELATLLIDCWKSGKAPLQVARALIAKYSITKRTTEG